MNVHISYRVSKTPDLENEINHQVEKLRKRLQVFRPDLVHLKGIVEQTPPGEGTHVALNLRLPSGQLAAKKNASNPTTAVKSAFDELLQQLVRHKDLLRSSHKWRRTKGNAHQDRELGVPFEQTIAAVLPLTISADDVRSYVDANLARLRRFVERELYFRRMESDQANDVLSIDEVVDEVIAQALTDGDRPEKLALEPWLYHLAMRVMDAMNASQKEMGNAVYLEESRRRQNVEASDEPALQFHQPDEIWTKESSVPDTRLVNPEQAAYSDEVVTLVQT